jgi:large-conductance mechanosensitive channel
MIILLRIILIAIIIYLLVRSFNSYFHQGEEKEQKPENKNPSPPKKISKETGEYIDYEEIDK